MPTCDSYSTPEIERTATFLLESLPKSWAVPLDIQSLTQPASPISCRDPEGHRGCVLPSSTQLLQPTSPTGTGDEVIPPKKDSTSHTDTRQEVKQGST